jgi:UDP-glucose-4-epimerase GalE
MHFAALAYVGESMQEPEMYYENNVIGTLNLLRSMHQWKTKKIVFSSTCTVYGEPKRLPILESDAKNPINPYGVSKLFSEYAIRDYCSAYGFSAILLRYFNAAGADKNGLVWERHNPETHLIPLVLQEAMRTKLGGDPNSTKLKIFGSDYPTEDGTCIRDYVHVSDLSKAHLLSIEKLLRSGDGFFEAYNLGGGKGYSVSQVIEIARKITQQPINFSEHDRRQGDPAVLIASSDLARSKLGWEPFHQNLEIIIRSAWDALVKNNLTSDINKFS